MGRFFGKILWRFSAGISKDHLYRDVLSGAAAGAGLSIRPARLCRGFFYCCQKLKMRHWQTAEQFVNAAFSFASDIF